MDRARYSFIAHTTHDYCNPISPAGVERFLDIMAPARGCRVLDIGCGKGELLARFAERFAARAVGVDTSDLFLNEARQRTASRAGEGSVELHTRDAAEFLASTSAEFDIACCIGSTHALGGLDTTMTTLARIVRAPGWALVGEGYWKRSPAPEYLQALGASASDFQTHAGNIVAGVRAGLVPMHASTASDDDWDRYEWAYCRNIELFVEQHPHDPDAAAMLDRARCWRDVVLHWGRDTLGFGLYLFRVPRT